MDIRKVALEPINIKKQSFVSAIQSVIQLLRVDGILDVIFGGLSVHKFSLVLAGEAVLQ